MYNTLNVDYISYSNNFSMITDGHRLSFGEIHHIIRLSFAWILI